MELVDTSSKVFRYTNAVKRKLPNKSITLVKTDSDSFALEIANFDKDNAHKPSVSHATYKGVIRVSDMYLSRETLTALVLNALELLAKEE